MKKGRFHEARMYASYVSIYLPGQTTVTLNSRPGNLLSFSEDDVSLETVQIRGDQSTLSSVDVVYSRMHPTFSKLGLIEFLEEGDEQRIDTIVHQDPVTISGNKFEVDPSLLSDNDWYEFTFKGKKLVVHKVDENRLEIYRVK